MRLSVQFLTILSMIGTGLGMAWLYDLYAWARKKLHLRFLLTFFFDVIYWLFFSFVVLFVLMKVNEGRLRVTLFFALFIGGILYFKIFSHPFMAVWDEIVRVVVALFRFIVRIIQMLLISPIKWILAGILTLVIGFCTGLWKGIWMLLRWFYRPFSFFFRLLKKFALALVRKVGKMIARLIKRKPRDE